MLPFKVLPKLHFRRWCCKPKALWVSWQWSWFLLQIYFRAVGKKICLKLLVWEDRSKFYSYIGVFVLLYSLRSFVLLVRLRFLWLHSSLVLLFGDRFLSSVETFKWDPLQSSENNRILFTYLVYLSSLPRFIFCCLFSANDFKNNADRQ